MVSTLDQLSTILGYITDKFQHALQRNAAETRLSSERFQSQSSPDDCKGLLCYKCKIAISTMHVRVCVCVLLESR